MDNGQAVTIWLARISTGLYAAALYSIWRGLDAQSRWLWTAAFFVYGLHVAGAYQYFYQWSHNVALAETARQTRDLFGVAWNGGLYINYLFTAVWLVDCLWWWAWPGNYAVRPRFVTAAIHAFIGFVILNATLVVWLLKALR